MPNEEQPFDRLPPALVDALRELDGPAVMPDDQRDADVLSGARRHLAQAAAIERKRRNLRLFFAGSAGGAIAAAAMIALVAFVNAPADNAASNAPAAAMQSPPTAPAIRGDIDADGTLDILDAYALAKQVSRNKAVDALQRHDMNGDKSVDLRDVDWIANQAVSLNTGERG
ncbi:MAG: dockerin type I domain-containing protein [Phycisphaeraceae bacterium]